MIRHILFFAFTDAATVRQILAVRKAFLQLPAQVDGVVSVEWGMNNSPEGKHAGLTHCVMMTLRDEVARQAYLLHPAHVALKGIFLPVLRDMIVLDYPVSPTAVY